MATESNVQQQQQAAAAPTIVPPSPNPHSPAATATTTTAPTSTSTGAIPANIMHGTRAANTQLHARTNSGLSYDGMSVGSWGAGTVLTTVSTQLIPDAATGLFMCPKHPDHKKMASPQELCTVCESEFKQQQQLLQEKRQSVHQQLENLQNIELQNWKKNAVFDDQSESQSVVHTTQPTTTPPHSMPPPHPHSMPPPHPHSMPPPHPHAAPPPHTAAYGHHPPPPPYPHATTSYHHHPSPYPHHPSSTSPYGAPAAPDPMAIHMQRMQQMQDWMLLQKEKECQALRQRYEEISASMQSLKVENALLTEKLHQQEQRMQQELKLIKLATLQKQQQRKLKQTLQQQQQNSNVRSLVLHPEQHQHDDEEDDDGYYEKDNISPLSSPQPRQQQPQSLTNGGYYHDDPIPAYEPPPTDDTETIEPPEPTWKQTTDTEQWKMDDHSNVLAGMSSVADEEERTVPKQLELDDKITVPVDETISIGTFPRQQQTHKPNTTNAFTFSEAVDEPQQRVEDEKETKEEEEPPPPKDTIQSHQSSSNNNTTSNSSDMDDTWSYEGGPAAEITPVVENFKRINLKKSANLLPPKPPQSSNNNNKGVSWTDDSASVAQSVASSTFGEDRHKVNDAEILDPYGDKGNFTGVILRSTGMPHGSGKMKYQEDNRTYEGEWRHGRWHGYGTATFANGDAYTGEYRFDQRHGSGKYDWHDGRTYDGIFREDKRHGKGKFTWPDGACYDGEFRNGQREGQGTYEFSDGGKYEGSWKDGRYSGYGVCSWEDGRKYSGEWLNGMAHGKGVEVFPDGTVRHDGMWIEDEPVIE